ncbi:MAG: hypothetical protein ACRCZF_10740 [Gemmataceae bacterium]
MRTIVFRVLAGLISVAFAGLLIFGDTTKMGLRGQFATGVLTTGFAFFAAFGTSLGERVLWVGFGGRDPGPPKAP